MHNDKIISVLVGLICACNNNDKTKNTDKMIILALSFPNNDFKENEIIDMLNNEKFKISPNCLNCKNPCGNTSDYDMNRLYNADENIRNIKLSILSTLNKISTHVYQNKIILSDEKISLIYKAISYISYDLNYKIFECLLNEINEELNYD